MIMEKKKLIKIIVPIVLVLVIAGIWVLKNAPWQDSSLTVSPNVQAGEQQTNSADTEEGVALEMDIVDMEELTAYGMPIIIDFGSQSCPPCLMMAPDLKTINEEMQGLAVVKYVDVGKNPQAASGLPIQATPTQLLFNADGTPYVPSESMTELGLSFIMYADKSTEEHVFTAHQGMLTAEDMREILADMGVVIS